MAKYHLGHNRSADIAVADEEDSFHYGLLKLGHEALGANEKAGVRGLSEEIAGGIFDLDMERILAAVNVEQFGSRKDFRAGKASFEMIDSHTGAYGGVTFGECSRFVGWDGGNQLAGGMFHQSHYSWGGIYGQETTTHRSCRFVSSYDM